jgi:hypothetical protein
LLLRAQPTDGAPGQRLTQFGNAGAGHLRLIQFELGKVLELGQFLQTYIRHACTANVKLGQVLELGKFLQACIGD